MPNRPIAETETSLIEQAQNGDRSAFEELVRIHYGCITNIIYRMCGDVGMAEDATQEAFLRAWVNLPSFHPSSPLRNWLCRIAVNAAVDMLRRRTEEPVEMEKMESLPVETPDPETLLIQKEQVAFLQQMLRTLPEGARKVLVLREYGQLSYQEIAVVLDIPLGTVMSRLNYGRNRLRELLKSHSILAERKYA